MVLVVIGVVYSTNLSPFSSLRTDSINHSIKSDQSINLSSNQFTNKCITDQSIDQSTNWSINWSTNWSINWSINLSTNQSANQHRQSTNQSTNRHNQSSNESTDQSSKHSAREAYARLIISQSFLLRERYGKANLWPFIHRRISSRNLFIQLVQLIQLIQVMLPSRDGCTPSHHGALIWGSIVPQFTVVFRLEKSKRVFRPAV